MSTKDTPGQFDCYARLRPDEPYFVLRAKDPVASELVREWARRRRALPGNETNPKIAEAITCADQMAAWYRQNVGLPATSTQPCGCDPGANYTSPNCPTGGKH